MSLEDFRHPKEDLTPEDDPNILPPIKRKYGGAKVAGQEEPRVSNEIDSLLKALEIAKQMAYNTDTSPTEILLDSGIDLSLLLGKAYLEGLHRTQILNQGLKESEQADSLGNLKLIRVGPKRSQPYSDPLCEKFFSKIFPSFLILLKGHKPFQEAYQVLLKMEVPEGDKPPTKEEIAKMKQEELERKKFERSSISQAFPTNQGTYQHSETLHPDFLTEEVIGPVSEILKDLEIPVVSSVAGVVGAVAKTAGELARARKKQARNFYNRRKNRK